MFQAMLLGFLTSLGCVCAYQKPFTHKIRIKALYNVARHFGHKDFQKATTTFLLVALFFFTHHLSVLHVQKSKLSFNFQLIGILQL